MDTLVATFPAHNPQLDAAFGIDDVIPCIPGLSQVALEAMQILEEGEPLASDTEPDLDSQHPLRDVIPNLPPPRDRTTGLPAVMLGTTTCSTRPASPTARTTRTTPSTQTGQCSGTDQTKEGDADDDANAQEKGKGKDSSTQGKGKTKHDEKSKGKTKNEGRQAKKSKGQGSKPIKSIFGKK